jgi:rare lipoprotein A
MSLLFAASCSTQPTYQPPPAVAPAPAPVPPPPRQSRAHSTGSVRASYQGDEMAGRRTASGEVFDPGALTAASKTLPIGSTVIVTNPKNGKSVMVRINDRGPHVRGRSLDLSRRAAEELGITEKGVARLKVERVDSKTARSTTAEAREESVSASTH